MKNAVLRYTNRYYRSLILVMLAFTLLGMVDLIDSPGNWLMYVPELALTLLFGIQLIRSKTRGYAYLDDKRIIIRLYRQKEIRFDDIIEVRKRPRQEMIITSPDKEIRINLNWLQDEDRERLEEVMRGYGYRN